MTDYIQLYSEIHVDRNKQKNITYPLNCLHLSNENEPITDMECKRIAFPNKNTKKVSISGGIRRSLSLLFYCSQHC